MKNINDFIANLNRGVARPTLYEVIISPPNLVLNEGIRSFTFLTDTAELPGRSSNVQEHRHYGPSRKIGMLPTYPEISIQTIITGDWAQRKVMMEWQDLVMGTHRRERYHPTARSSNIGYYDHYVGTVEINMYAEGVDEKQLTVKLIEAWPAQITTIPLSWGDNDSAARINIQFQYRYFEEEYYTSSSYSRINDFDADNL